MINDLVLGKVQLRRVDHIRNILLLIILGPPFEIHNILAYCCDSVLIPYIQLYSLRLRVFDDIIGWPTYRRNHVIDNGWAIVGTEQSGGLSE